MKKQIFKANWERYRELGFIPYPASRKGKNPVTKWGDDLPSPLSDDYAEWEEKYPDANVWLYLGNDFVVIDPDGAGAEDFVKSLGLPPCPTSISGNKSIHRWFKSPPNIKPIKAMNGQDQTFLEVRTGSMGILAPPSIHPETGRPYRWLKGLSPWEISFPLLPMEAYDKIKALLPNREPEMEVPEDVSGRFNVAKYLTHYGIKFKIKRDGTRTIHQLERCPFADEHTTKDVQGDSSIIQGSDGKLGYNCFHNHCAFRTWKDARAAISGTAGLRQFCESKQEQRAIETISDAVFTSDEFARLNIPEKKKILIPWLTEGSISLIAGWRGIGKTCFLLSIFDAVTKGESFGPWQTESPVPSLYIDGEMATADIQERLRNLGTIDKRLAPLYIYSVAYGNLLGLPRANLLSSKWRDALMKFALNNGILLIAFDNISSLAPGIKENAKEEWDPINQWLLQLRFKGIASALAHHTGKEGDQRGTSAREDNLDNSITLVKPYTYETEQGARFIVKFKKSRARLSDLPLLAEVEFTLTEKDGQVQWAWGGVKKKTQIEILRMIDEGVTQKDIAELLGVTKGYVSQVKTKAIKDNLIGRNGQLTQSGYELVYQGPDEDQVD